MMNEPPSSRPLGSLAQSARGKSLKTARWILIVIGLLTGAANGFMLSNVEKEADDAIAKETKNLGPGMAVDQAQVKELRETVIRFCYLIYGGTIALGVLFIVLGVAVYRIPVLATVLGLVLYISANLLFAAINPPSLGIGLIVKIIIIVALVKAVQSAIAYQREMQLETQPSL